MRGRIATTVAACLAFVAIVLGLYVSAIVRQNEGLSEAELRELGTVVLPEPRALAAFNLERAGGGGFELEDLRQGWTMLYFGFTSCPDVCPTTLGSLAKARTEWLESDASAEPYRVMMVSVDPERDTKQRLEDYVTAFSSEFAAARGSRAAVVELAEQVGVSFAPVPASGDEAGYTVEHSTHLALIDAQGRYRAYLKAPHSVEQINETFRTLVTRR